MTRITRLPLIRTMGIILMFLWSLEIEAQIVKNPVLTWDQEVGCIEFDDGAEDSVHFNEEIEETPCIRICKDSAVNYFLDEPNASDVAWDVNGGTIVTSSVTGAQINWDSTDFGNLTVTVLYPDETTRVLTLCMEKVISPTAYFEIDSIDPHQAEFCTYQPIAFKNLSTDNGGSAIVSYLWDFGDGNTSATKNPTHTYTSGGAYDVILTVTNSCNCTSTYHFGVHVEDSPAVEISCASIVCEHEHATYSVNDGCGGEWMVIGGDIIADYGTSIEVVWNQVDPEDGFGYVSYRSHCSCPSWTTVKIPVILQTGIIKGPDVVCEGSQGIYSLPQWPTTDFVWMIDGDPNHPMLVKSQQRNEIIVDGQTPGSYTLSVDYTNTLIAGGGCQGHATFDFIVEARPEIITDPELLICQGESKTFTTQLGFPVRWNIRHNNILVYDVVTTSFNYTFNEGGSYVVTADNNDCISFPMVVNVIGTPMISNNISGPSQVCLNTPYTYSINESQPGYTYVWSVTGGIVLGNNTGSSISARFSSPTGSVTVIKTIIVNGVKCESTPKTRNVSQVNMNPQIVHPNGTTSFCPSSQTTFTVNTGGTPDHIKWSIVGTPGNTNNFGNIISGINSKTVTVSFNNISNNITTGILRVEVTKCNLTTFDTYIINLKSKPVMTLSPIGVVCPSDSNINITVNTSPAVTENVMVSFDGGVPQGPYLITSGTPISIPNGFSNQTGVAQAQKIKVFLTGYCKFQVETEQMVTVNAEIDVAILEGYRFIVCPSNYTPVTLTSSVPAGSGVTGYQWYRNNALIPGAGTSTYTIPGGTPQGIYYVEVTDDNGCKSQSPPVTVIADCTVYPGCTITPNPNVNVTASWSGCNTITANVTYNGSPTITWTGSEDLTLTGSASSPNTTFTTNVAGAHTVIAELNYGTCRVIEQFTVVKNYEAALKAEVVCVGPGLYNVTLRNASALFDILPGAVTYTYSGTGITGSPTGQSITLTNVSPGSKNYTITLTSPGKPTCSKIISVDLDGIPNTNFTVSPLTYCSDETLSLTVPGGRLPGYIYDWVFFDTSYTADDDTTDIQLSEGNSYPIGLRITTPEGCVYETLPANRPIVVINEPLLGMGTIIPTSAAYCEGNELPLSFLPGSGDPTPSDIIWMLDDQPVHTGMTYTPTQSGSYWPVLIDTNGCKSYEMAKNTRNYSISPPPHVSIVGTTSMCAGENTVLTGIITDNTVEHRWTGPFLPTGYNTWVTGAANLNLSLSGLATGTYTYTLEARLASDASCAESASVQVVVHPPVNVSIDPPVVTGCNPYTVQLVANGTPSGGTYNWSNGMTGQTIYVPHGGVYQVTYTAPSGCKAIYSVAAPHNPDRVLWIVPEGCYPNVCDAYLLGPLGDYEHYDWRVNDITTQAGGGNVPEQPVNDGGIFQLLLTEQICTFGSNRPNITPDIIHCPPRPCNFNATFNYTGNVPGGFTFSVTLFNPLGTWQSVYLSSFNNFGTFVPATHLLSPGWNTITVSFYVNGNFYPGANDIFLLQGHYCTDQVPIQLYEVSMKQGKVQEPLLELSPNPASETTTASYDVGTEYDAAQYIVVYDMLGVQRLKQTAGGKQGEVTLNVSFLPPGTYVVSLENNNTRIIQQKLIKK